MAGGRVNCRVLWSVSACRGQVRGQVTDYASPSLSKAHRSSGGQEGSRATRLVGPRYARLSATTIRNTSTTCSSAVCVSDRRHAHPAGRKAGARPAVRDWLLFSWPLVRPSGRTTDWREKGQPSSAVNPLNRWRSLISTLSATVRSMTDRRYLHDSIGLFHQTEPGGPRDVARA